MVPKVGPWELLFAAWVVALFATLGVLFIGEIMGQAPCTLCWYQRTFMFPLPILLAIACYRSDVGVWRYALPLGTAGWLVAAYHSLLYLDIIPEVIAPCSDAGPSCTGADMTILGGIPIPLLSLAAFTFIAVSLALTSRRTAA
jgi:disulfide bond formation protein DsbB